LYGRLVAPRTEFPDGREDDVEATPAAGYLQQIDRPMKHRRCVLDVALSDAGEGQVSEHDRLRLVTTLQAAGGEFQDRSGLGTVAEGEVAGAAHPLQPVGGEEAVAGIGGLHRLQVLFGGTEGRLARSPLTEHGVALADMQERQTWQGMAAAIAGEYARLLRQPEPGPRIVLAVEGHEALPQAREVALGPCAEWGLKRGDHRLGRQRPH
jgi:hypothetical protein